MTDAPVIAAKDIDGLPRHMLTRGAGAVSEGRVDSREGHGEFVARAGHGCVNRALPAWKKLTAPRPVARSGIPASGV